jgi:DNA helicase-2/ATP-dependent DNA helicase PcrA
MRQPSVFQQKIFDQITRTNNSIVIGAVAGSGKTTTIEHGSSLISSRKSTIFLAFNKSIVEELKTRLPQHVYVSTLHSFGFRQALKNIGQIKIAENKVWRWIDICSKAWKNVPKEELPEYGYRISQMVDLMRMTLTLEDHDEIEAMCDKYGIWCVNKLQIIHAIQVLGKMTKDMTAFDFADMIYQPAIKNMRLQKFDTVFIDECQDLNKAQQTMVKKIVKPFGGRMIAVGDPRQAIYGFAGADTKSFENMKSMFKNTVTLPLSVCYRCPKKIVEHAQELNPEIQSFEAQVDGEVREGSWKELKDGDWGLCRNTKPLVEMFMELIKIGVKAKIKGREIGDNLIHMLKKTNATIMEKAVKQFDKDLIMINIKLKQKRVRRPEFHPKYVNHVERVEIIKIIGQGMIMVKDVIKRIESIFTDDREGVMLSTIHKSKGLEANRIFVICKELMPSKFATTEDELLQEENLKYVLRTRAKKSLIYINDFPIVKQPTVNVNDVDVQAKKYTAETLMEKAAGIVKASQERLFIES